MFSSLGAKINAAMSASATSAELKKTPQAAAQPMHLPVRQREKGCEKIHKK
jgi:hypothetical protein